MSKGERAARELLAEKVIRLVQDRMVANMPFFNRAILRMPVSFIREDDTEFGIDHDFGCDGKEIFCTAEDVIGLYREEPNRLSRIYMHMIFHCIYCHPFQYDRMNFGLWDFSADVAVENTLLEMKWKDMELPGDFERKSLIESLKYKVHPLTAENLYSYYTKNPEDAKKDLQTAERFRMDTHQFWADYHALISKEYFSDSDQFNIQGNKTSEYWKQIGKSIQLDVEAFEKYQDTMPGSAIENIRQAFRQKQDYSEFLRKFVQQREELKVNQEEFDYIYYTYGMQLYGNLPLIEPLEYQEEKKIKDLVIAIDTSGSCQGAVVRNFLNRTYSILKNQTHFFRNMNVHIIQCDCEVKSDQRITSEEEFEQYMKNLKVEGFGGTDFRPVFAHVDRLIRDREFRELKGLLYFTDGLGTYPKHMPEYPTAFLILEDKNEKPNVPGWAIKMILEEDELYH